MKNQNMFEVFEAIENAKKELDYQAISVESGQASGAALNSAEKARLFNAAKITKLKRLKKIKELNLAALELLALHADIEKIETYASYALDKVAKFSEVCANVESFNRGDNVTGIAAFRFMLQNKDRVVKTGEVTQYILKNCFVELSTASSQSSNSLKALTAMNAVQCIKTGYYRIIDDAFFTKLLDEKLPAITNRNGIEV